MITGEARDGHGQLVEKPTQAKSRQEPAYRQERNATMKASRISSSLFVLLLSLCTLPGWPLTAEGHAATHWLPPMLSAQRKTSIIPHLSRLALPQHISYYSSQAPNPRMPVVLPGNCAPGKQAFLAATAVVSSTDVWAVGDCAGNNGYKQTLTEHWNGKHWQVVASPNVGSSNNYLYGVAAVAATDGRISSSDVWAVGSSVANNGPPQTLTERWDGHRWSVVTSPNPGASDNELDGVVMISSSDVWAVGSYVGNGTYQTLTEHWDGRRWSVVKSPDIGSSANELYGVAAAPAPAGTLPGRQRGISSTDVWAVGRYFNGAYRTLTEHWNGRGWSVVRSPNPGSSDNYMNDVAVVSSNDVWAVGYYFADNNSYQTLTEHWDGRRWSVIKSPNAGSSDNLLSGVAEVSASDVWIVGWYYNTHNAVFQTLTMHWDGRRWSVIKSPNIGSSANYLNGVVVVSSGDVWAVGYLYNSNGSSIDTLTEHWNGTQWSVIPSP